MARNQHSFAKRQREIEKKRKADEKRARRQHRKTEPDEGGESGAHSSDSESGPTT
jgi:hypothetical protein